MYKKYSKVQHTNTYESTIEFVKYFFVSYKFKKNIIDLACGGGANTIYLAEKFKSSFIIGIDINKDF